MIGTRFIYVDSEDKKEQIKKFCMEHGIFLNILDTQNNKGQKRWICNVIAGPSFYEQIKQMA